MIEASKSYRQHSFKHHWIVCESGNRWRQCVLRLVPAWFSQDDSFSIKNVLAGEVLASTWRLPYGVMLWEIDSASMLPKIQAISSLPVDRDRWLQIVAVDRLSPHDRCSLSEMGVAAVIQHPEELLRLERMISGHFAGARRLLH